MSRQAVTTCMHAPLTHRTTTGGRCCCSPFPCSPPLPPDACFPRQQHVCLRGIPPRPQDERCSFLCTAVTMESRAEEDQRELAVGHWIFEHHCLTASPIGPRAGPPFRNEPGSPASPGCLYCRHGAASSSRTAGNPHCYCRQSGTSCHAVGLPPQLTCSLLRPQSPRELWSPRTHQP